MVGQIKDINERNDEIKIKSGVQLIATYPRQPLGFDKYILKM